MEPKRPGIKVLEPGYKQGELLGEGAYGSVYKVTKLDGTSLACKVIKSDGFNIPRSVIIEMSSYRSVIGIDNVLQLDHVNIEPKQVELFSPLMDSDLRTWHKENELLRRLNCLDHFYSQIITAIGEMHHRGIVHLDIKPENILVKEGKLPDCYIGDYGLSRYTFCGRDIEELDNTMTTEAYAPPEYFNKKGQSSKKSDVYCFAVSMIEYIINSKRFHSNTIYDLYIENGNIQPSKFRQIAKDENGKYSIINVFKIIESAIGNAVKYIDPDLIKELSDMLQFDPKYRPSPYRSKYYKGSPPNDDYDPGLVYYDIPKTAVMALVNECNKLQLIDRISIDVLDIFFRAKMGTDPTLVADAVIHLYLRINNYLTPFDEMSRAKSQVIEQAFYTFQDLKYIIPSCEQGRTFKKYGHLTIDQYLNVILNRQ